MWVRGQFQRALVLVRVGAMAGPNMCLLRPIDLALFAIIFPVYSFGSLPEAAILAQQPQPNFASDLRTILSMSGVQLVTNRFWRLAFLVALSLDGEALGAGRLRETLC